MKRLDDIHDDAFDALESRDGLHGILVRKEGTAGREVVVAVRAGAWEDNWVTDSK